ncbi:MAG TPA: YihY/virulence factor BrkB family protein [Chitinophagales bacterium]|nr:YihY/virulence factor BrkB family protein [Chitinophagales bacterium]
MKLRARLLHTGWNMFKNSFQLFKNHDTLTLGAALSYYTVFSIAPMLIIVISVLGIVLGPEAVMGEIKGKAQSFMGARGAKDLQDIIIAFYKPGENKLATAIATILLLIGATSVFDQLRTSLNTIWNVKPQIRKPVLKFIANRLFSFAMIACLGFLLMISLVIQSILTAFTAYLNQWLPDISVMLLKAVELLLSYSLTALLFAFVYRFMSDAKPQWNSVWLGAMFTAFLFGIGKYLISLYIGRSNLADTYGAAGSIVVILVWVFYSSQILFFGAEFTRALAIERGVSLDPHAVKPNRDSGIINKHVPDKKEGV